MPSLRLQYTHEIPLSEQGTRAGQTLRFQRKRQQAGKQGLSSDSEAESRLRGWHIGVPFSTAAASTSSTVAGATNAGKSARVYAQYLKVSSEIPAADHKTRPRVCWFWFLCLIAYTLAALAPAPLRQFSHK
jgi:hypothetical protein